MREIKFKAYHSEYGVGGVISMSFYEKTRDINSDTECYAYYPKMNDSLLTSYNDVELMQYTGLKDKNGAEIYEGDIVLFDSRECLVTFKDGNFGVKQLMRVNLYTDEMREYQEPLWNLVVDGCEVIGNIYENPELLERK